MTDFFKALTFIQEFVDEYYASESDQVLYEFGDLLEEAEKMLEPRPLTLKRMYEISVRDYDINTQIDIECTYKMSQYE